MQLISDEAYEKQEKQQQEKEKVATKVQQMHVTQEAKATQDKKTSEKTLFKKLWNSKPADPERAERISLADIKNQVSLMKLVETDKQEQIKELLEDNEVSELKQEVINVMAFPHTDPRKRQVFSALLNKSKIVNSYVNDNVLFRLFNRANSHMKFSAIYATNYLKAGKLVEEYDAEKAKQAQQPIPPETKEEPKEETKEESESETE
jgi:Mg/Co/Ni transporter MgtE